MVHQSCTPTITLTLDNDFVTISVNDAVVNAFSVVNDYLFQKKKALTALSNSFQKKALALTALSNSFPKITLALTALSNSFPKNEFSVNDNYFIVNDLIYR